MSIRQSFRSRSPVTGDKMIFQGAIMPNVTVEFHVLKKEKYNWNRA